MKDGSVLAGTTSPLTDQQKTDCIGVVFWVGDPTNVTNGDPALRNEHPGCTHGLVVSLENAYNGRSFVFRWQDPDWSDIAKWQETNLTGYESMATGTGDTDNFQKIMGYNNTKVIEQYNAYCDSQGAEMIKYKVEPVTVISQFESKFPAPANSSGWYLPSPKELSTLFSGWYDGNIWKIQQAGLGSLVSNSELMDLRIETLRGNVEETKMTSSRYWSSSQNADYPGSAYNILSGELRSDGKKSFTFRVRPVLAF